MARARSVAMFLNSVFHRGLCHRVCRRTLVLIAAGLLLRTPHVAIPPAEPQARVEPEQVERAVDDMMMLHELNVTSPSGKKTSTPKSM